jgi:hypothetical protein
MAAAGVVLVIAGLLVSKQLAPGPGNPTPLESGPGNGLASQLLQSTGAEQPAVPAPGTINNIPLPSTPTTRPSKGASQASSSLSPAFATAPSDQTQTTTATTTATTTPTTTPTTLPCGLLGQGLQQAQILPCGATTRSTR